MATDARCGVAGCDRPAYVGEGAGALCRRHFVDAMRPFCDDADEVYADLLVDDEDESRRWTRLGEPDPAASRWRSPDEEG